MAISPEVDTEIENEASALKPEDFLHPQTGISEFQIDFSNILGRVTEDKDHLVAAGYPVENLYKNYCLQEKLSLGHGKRISTEVVPAEDDQKYTAGIEQAKTAKKVLAAAAKFIVNNTDSNEIRKVYNAMRKGQTDIDVIIYNISAVNFARNHMDIVSRIRPGKVTMDEAYLNNVESQAVELTKLKGVTTVSEEKPEQSVDYQNRILTLCIKAYRDIKQYADLAFLFDPDHYTKYYSDYETPKTDSTKTEPQVEAATTKKTENVIETKEMETASASV